MRRNSGRLTGTHSHYQGRLGEHIISWNCKAARHNGNKEIFSQNHVCIISFNPKLCILFRFLLGNKRPASRWDTPSPSTELMTRGPPATSSMGGVNNDSGDDDDNALPVAFGRGRGKKRKKNKGKNKGKNSK